MSKFKHDQYLGIYVLTSNNNFYLKKYIASNPETNTTDIILEPLNGTSSPELLSLSESNFTSNISDPKIMTPLELYLDQLTDIELLDIILYLCVSGEDMNIIINTILLIKDNLSKRDDESSSIMTELKNELQDIKSMIVHKGKTTESS